MKKKIMDDKLKNMQKEMRKVGRFTKYCSDCNKIFGSDDIEIFLRMVAEHDCKNKSKGGN